jgi:hypothetical protein
MIHRSGKNLMQKAALHFPSWNDQT